MKLITESPEESKGRRRTRFILLLLLAYCSVCLMVSIVVDFMDFSDSNSLPFSIRASTGADYSKDLFIQSVPPVEISIIQELIEDNYGEAENIFNRMATVTAIMGQPVATATPLPEMGLVTTKTTNPSGLPTSTSYIKQPTATLGIGTLPATATATSIYSPTVTLIGTGTITPTATKSATSTATVVKTYTATPFKTATSTSVYYNTPTATNPAATATNPAATATRTPYVTATTYPTKTNTPVKTATPYPTNTSQPTLAPTYPPTLTPPSGNVIVITPDPIGGGIPGPSLTPGGDLGYYPGIPVTGRESPSSLLIHFGLLSGNPFILELIKELLPALFFSFLLAGLIKALTRTI